MFIEPFNILSTDKVDDTKYCVRIFVPLRPESSYEYLEFFNKVAQQFCADYNCKFGGGLDVHFNPANDSSILMFYVKEYKHPEKHKLTLKKYNRLK